MNVDLKTIPILVNGLPSSGKTTFIRGMLSLAKRRNDPIAAFKPFDVALMKRNATEQPGDGEIYCQDMANEPMESLVSPYIAHENYPVEMAFRRDGISINEHFLKERLSILSQHYKKTFIESPGSLFEPITEKKLYFEWMLSLSNQILWIMDLSLDRFTHNLAELTLLKNLDCKVSILFNNPQKNQNQDLMFYLWEKIESKMETQALGMIPFIKDFPNQIGELADKMEENIGSFLDLVFD